MLLNFRDKIWVYAQIKQDRIHKVGMTFVIREGGILGLYRYAFTIFEKKKKINMKIYRKVQSIQVSYIFFKQSEAFFP